MAEIISLADAKFEQEWQRILPILKEIETAFNARPLTPLEEIEEAALETQLNAMALCTKAKLLLLRALNNPEIGQLTSSEVRLKKLLNADRDVVHALSRDDDHAR